MKSILPLAAALVSLAACSGGAGDGNSTAAAASPVVAVAAPAGKAWSDVVAKTEEGYRMGNPDAAIKLVEYGSRTCPVCGAFAREAFQPLTKNYVDTGKVSFEFRDYMVHGAPDLALAMLETCGSTESVFPILEQNYANQSAFLDRLQALTPAQQQQMQSMPPLKVVQTLAQEMGAIDFVKQRGIPEAKARECIASQARLEAVAKPTEAANAAGKITGTPTFFINDAVVPGAVTWEQLEAALKRAGA